ncbi:MAG: hypothetical protein WBY53_09840 [Acidobacteriaceae bacterium]
MKKSSAFCYAAAGVLVISGGVVALGQKLDVKIIQRQTSETGYTYQVAGHANSTSNGSADCNANSYGNSANVNCSGSGSSQSSYTAPMVYSYSVTGATFSLLLPDGRVAVVNCVSKFAEHFAGAAGNHRSCRMPIIDNVNVEFKGNKAKIFWPVSLDGKKLESETYTILAVLPK